MIEEVKSRHNKLRQTVGDKNLHSLFPDDFEFFAVSLELVDAVGRIQDMLTFPIMPQNISINGQTASSIKKSSSSIISLYNPTFQPITISIRGNFGRKFRILLGDEQTVAESIGLREKNGAVRGSSVNTFNSRVKTGYGSTKVLERIIKGSLNVDENGNAMKLYFYNLAFNSNFLVEINNYSFSIDEKSTNNTWNYSINMTAIATAEQVRQNGKSSIIKVAALNEINKFLNDFSDDQRKYVFSKERFKKNKTQLANTF